MSKPCCHLPVLLTGKVVLMHQHREEPDKIINTESRLSLRMNISSQLLSTLFIDSLTLLYTKVNILSDTLAYRIWCLNFSRKRSLVWILFLHSFSKDTMQWLQYWSRLPWKAEICDHVFSNSPSFYLISPLLLIYHLQMRPK